MQWLLHGKTTEAAAGGAAGAAAAALRRHGHLTHAVDELGLDSVVDLSQIVRAAQANQWDIFTTDAELVRVVYDEKIWFKRSIAFLQLAGEDVESRRAGNAVDRLFARYKRLTPGRLYTVTETRVKVRQLPAKKN